MFKLKKTILAASFGIIFVGAFAAQAQELGEAPAKKPAKAQKTATVQAGPSVAAVAPEATTAKATTGLMPHFSPGPGAQVAEEFAKMQSETALLRARIEQTKAKAELAVLERQVIEAGRPPEDMEKVRAEAEAKRAKDAKEAERDRAALKEEIREQLFRELQDQRTSTGSQAGATAEKPAEAAAAPVMIPAPPSVVAIYGVGKEMYASLRSHDGSSFDAIKGDQLADGYKVTSINSRQVELVREGKKYTLRVFGGNEAKSGVTSTAIAGQHGQNLMGGAINTGDSPGVGIIPMR